jgi:hypothetical protein
MQRGKSFSQQRREILVAGFIELRDRLREIERDLQRRSGKEHQRLVRSFETSREKISAIISEYREYLPSVAVGRCPFCDDLTYHSLDNLGIDGMWWNCDSSTRALREELCTHFLVLSGALKLDHPVESWPSLVKPGPEVPFVVPRILEHPDIRATVSRVKIGRHTGYPVIYFGSSRPNDLPLVNEWGIKFYRFHTEEGALRWDSVVDLGGDYDYDLEKWILQGKLLWTSPEDTLMKLHSENADCPYLNLKGRREILRVQSGQVWATAEEYQAKYGNKD